MVKSNKIVQAHGLHAARKEKILKVAEKPNEFRMKNNAEKKEGGK